MAASVESAYRLKITDVDRRLMSFEAKRSNDVLSPSPRTSAARTAAASPGKLWRKDPPGLISSPPGSPVSRPSTGWSSPPKSPSQGSTFVVFDSLGGGRTLVHASSSKSLSVFSDGHDTAEVEGEEPMLTSPDELVRQEQESADARDEFQAEVAAFADRQKEGCRRSKPAIGNLAKGFLLRPVHNVYE